MGIAVHYLVMPTGLISSRKHLPLVIRSHDAWELPGLGQARGTALFAALAPALEACYPARAVRLCRQHCRQAEKYAGAHLT